MMNTMKKSIVTISRRSKKFNTRKRKLEDDMNKMQEALQKANIDCDAALDNLMKKASVLPKAIIQGTYIQNIP